MIYKNILSLSLYTVYILQWPFIATCKKTTHIFICVNHLIFYAYERENGIWNIWFRCRFLLVLFYNSQGSSRKSDILHCKNSSKLIHRHFRLFSKSITWTIVKIKWVTHFWKHIKIAFNNEHSASPKAFIENFIMKKDNESKNNCFLRLRLKVFLYMLYH